MQITFLQLNILWEQKDKNLKQVTDLIRAHQGADIYVLPEMFQTGFSMRPESLAENLNTSHTLTSLKELATQKDALITGSIMTQKNNHYFNTFFAIQKDHPTYTYNKKHLFGFGKETAHYTPGNQRTWFEYKNWRIMPFICYDLRFPIWMRNDQDIDLYIGVANWPESRIDAWQSLLKARAIENQAYVAGVNRIGDAPNGLSYNGRSALYGPDGAEHILMSENKIVENTQISLDFLKEFRSNFPFLKDRDNFSLS